MNEETTPGPTAPEKTYFYVDRQNVRHDFIEIAASAMPGFVECRKSDGRVLVVHLGNIRCEE